MSQKHPRTIKTLFILLVITAMSIPSLASATATPHITEIMYNPPGTDTGREWVEVKLGAGSESILEYYLRENEVNHTIKVFEGYEAEESGEYAIIADNPAKFLIDYPDYKGALYDSVFSLKNTGELIQLVNDNQDIIDSYEYVPFEESYESDVTLQLAGIEWEVGNATPGAGFETASAPNAPGDDSASGTTSDSSKTSDSPSKIKKSTLASNKKTVPIKNNNVFEAANIKEEIVGYVGIVIDFAYTRDHKVNWAYGDGSSDYGVRGRHVYNFKGEYLVIGSYREDDEEYIEYIKVTVLETQLELGGTGENQQYLEIFNRSESPMNIEGFMIKLREDSDYKYIFPKNTYILDSNSIKVPWYLLQKFNRGWEYKNTDLIRLEYPQGKN
jgi:hypothetical protein